MATHLSSHRGIDDDSGQFTRCVPGVKKVEVVIFIPLHMAECWPVRFAIHGGLAVFGNMQSIMSKYGLTQPEAYSSRLPVAPGINHHFCDPFGGKKVIFSLPHRFHTTT